MLGIITDDDCHKIRAAKYCSIYCEKMTSHNEAFMSIFLLYF